MNHPRLSGSARGRSSSLPSTRESVSGISFTNPAALESRRAVCGYFQSSVQVGLGKAGKRVRLLIPSLTTLSSVSSAVNRPTSWWAGGHSSSFKSSDPSRSGMSFTNPVLWTLSEACCARLISFFSQCQFVLFGKGQKAGPALALNFEKGGNFVA